MWPYPAYSPYPPPPGYINTIPYPIYQAYIAAPPAPAPAPTPHLPPTHNATYLYPAAHCTIYVMSSSSFNPAAAINDPICSTYTVPCGMSVNEFIQQIGGDKEATMTEWYEGGNGTWRMGLSVEGGTDGAKKSLEAYGFKRSGGIWVRVAK